MDRRIPAHDSFDVIVAGYGFAGGAAAIAAHDAGSRVLLLEKMSIPGGISICSGGGLRVATDADRAFEYLRATNDGTTPDDLLRAFAIEMTQLEERLRALAAKAQPEQAVAAGRLIDRERERKAEARATWESAWRKLERAAR